MKTLADDIDALQSNYPAVARLVGEEWFRAAAAVYVRQTIPVEPSLLRYGAVVFGCTGRSLACKLTHTKEQRLARWLLMTRDRIVGDDLPYTQEALARMLGVNRPTASIAAEALKERGAIDYHRGRIRIVNRGALESVSCEDYRAYREAYEQLLGPMPTPT